MWLYQSVRERFDCTSCKRRGLCASRGCDDYPSRADTAGARPVFTMPPLHGDGVEYLDWTDCPVSHRESPSWAWALVEVYSDFREGRYWLPEKNIVSQPYGYVTIMRMIGALDAAKREADARRRD